MGRREKPLEPSAGPVQRFAYELRKFRAEAGGPTYRTLAGRVPYSAPTLSAAAAGERLPSLPVLLAYVEACGGGAEEAAEWERRWYETLAAVEPAPDGGESPYPGLARFGPGDRARYHGRDDLIAELLALTARRRVTAVVGASGSGKSSLLRAGLVPALRERGAERADGGEAARLAAIRILTPGERPARTHRALFEPSTADGDTLLVVDQFEEVFSLCHDPAERDRFLDLLLAARDPADRLRVVLAVRADFYGRCAEHGPLADVLRDATLLVGPMPPHRLREAIVRPAAAERLVVERTLTARIVADVGDEPGGLPLMAHALREVWRRRSGKTLTLAAYEAIGGVRGAIAHTAEDVFGRFTEAEAAVARTLLLRMVAPGDGTQDTRRTVERAELGPHCGAVLERLVAARLLTVDGTHVDVAHEALLSAWPRLRGWIETDRERLRLHRALTEAALIWRDLDRDPGALYRGTRLSAAREAFTDASELTTLEAEFLQAAVAAHDHRARMRARAVRRTRALLSALAVLLCLAAVAGTIAWQQNRAGDLRAAEAQGRRIAGIAQTLRVTDPRTAMRLGVAAWRIADLPETREAVRTAGVQREAGTAAGFEAADAMNAPSYLSHDGRVLTAVGRDKVTWWDARSGRRLGTDNKKGIFKDYTGASPDGRFIALHTARGFAIRDVREGRTLGQPFGPRDWRNADGGFGPDGRLFVTRTELGSRVLVQVWDVRRHRRLARVTGDITSDSPFPLLSPDGRLLVTCSEDGRRMTLHTVGDGRARRAPWPRKVQRQACGAEERTFTPDSRALSFDVGDGIRTWEVGSGQERPRLDVPDVGEWQGDYSEDGTWAVTTGARELALWRLTTPGAPLMRYTLPEGTVGTARLDTASGMLRYQASGTVVRSIDVRDALASRRGGGPLAGAGFSPDGRTLAVARRDREGQEVQLRDARDGRLRARLPGRVCRDCVTPLLGFSPSGGTLAYTAGVGEEQGAPVGTIVRRWSVGERRPRASEFVPSMVEDLVVPSDKAPLVTFGSPASDSPAQVQDNDAPELDIWKVGERAGSRELRRPMGTHGATLSPDGRTVLAWNGQLTDIRTGRSTRVLRGEGDLRQVAFSPDGRFLAVSDSDGRVALWNARGTRRLGVLATGSPAAVPEESVALAFSPDGRHLALGQTDGTVRLWETDTPRLTGAAYPGTDGPVLALGFAGGALRVATPRTATRSLPLAPGRAAAAACRRADGGLTRAEWRAYVPALPFRKTC
ncbi:putative WD repeat-containing protein [Streptomyces aurantiacus JA 4570]|uniref:Putative WD repeat-containing protein n=1 Tax=Streptomyces aurantiacus JA 4570 TaxID=1286094 RepID=S4AE34_9ACTN|nr:hypothetical protein [Streptomyces aurantiacus]EPH39712.1 putative WD repeat-containing protein [Streptomyces aurantiacus JA 4570]